LRCYTTTPAGGPLSRANAVERFAQSAVVLAGLRCAILARNLHIGPDGLSYLELARAYLRHDWSTAVNGYWGPLYAWLVASVLSIVRPTASQELASVRGLNFLIFLFCLYAFARFWRIVADHSRKAQDSGSVLADAYPTGWVVTGYLLFATTVPWFIEEVGPDVLVAGMVLLIAGYALELADGKRQSIACYAVFGSLLAVAFYTKAILLYFGIFTLLALAARAFRAGNYRGPLTAALLYMLVISPYVAALSRTLGYFSVGESGRLNYAWYVNGIETGDSAEGNAPFPFFPGPVILKSPRVFRLPYLPGITYAPWYDAARFDKHSRASFTIRGEIRQLATNLRSLKQDVVDLDGAFLVCLIVLISLAPRDFLRRFSNAALCIVPAVMIIGMYLLVHLVGRFVFGFSLVLWGVCFSCCRLPSRSPSPLPSDDRLVARRMLLAGILVFAAQALPGLLHYLASPSQNLIDRDAQIAGALPNYGVFPGDFVGIIGQGQGALWAHWARVSLTAELPSPDSASFWTGSHEVRQTVLDAMKQAGAKAVVWRRDSDHPCPPEWIELPKASGCMISLSSSHPGSG